MTRHLNPIGWTSLVVAMAADSILHGLLTAITIVGVLVGMTCHVIQTRIQYQTARRRREEEARQAEHDRIFPPRIWGKTE